MITSASKSSSFTINKIFAASLCLISSLSFGMDVFSGNFYGILNSKTEKTVIWNLEENQNVFIFDFPNLSTQGRTFNRITQFTEQTQSNQGYPRVLSNNEIEKYIESLRRNQANFAFGHDVLVNELVQFFNLADRDKIELHPEEIILRDFLIKQGLIKIWRNFYQAIKPEIVILSIPQTQLKKADEPTINELARFTIFSHEIAHGEYYSNPYYSNYCRQFWSKSLSDSQRQAFIDFFKKYNYDTNNAELVVNEMQAYLIFTPDKNSFNAKKLGVSDEELESMRSIFQQGNPPTKMRLHSK